MTKIWNKPTDYKESKKFIKNNITRGNFQVQDKYFHMAKSAGYRARSAFKLKEIDERFDLIQPGYDILDLGCAPGSFLQYINQKVNSHLGNDKSIDRGKIVGMDLKKVDKVNKNVITFEQDITNIEEVLEKLNSIGVNKLDLVISDIAPNTSGNSDVDQYRSVELNLAIVNISENLLKKGGNLLLKVFVGSDVNELIQPIMNKYNKLIQIKPKACRKRSFEKYFVCLDKKK